MVELDDNVRMGLLIGAAAIVIFVLVMTGIVFGGDKLFLIDLIGVGIKKHSAQSQDLALKTSLAYLRQPSWGVSTILLQKMIWTGKPF